VRDACLAIKSSFHVCLSSFMWLIRGSILIIGIRARLKIWSCACPGEATLLVPRGGRPSLGGATRWRWRAHYHQRGSWWSPLGDIGRREVAIGKAVDEDDRWWKRCGARSLMKIIVWESICQGVMSMQVSTFRPWVVVMSKCLFLWGSVAVEACHIRGVARQKGSTCVKDKVAAWPSACLGEKIKLGV
jgi:hypothetical protein